MKKRLLAVFMTFCMMLSMVPATFAADGESTYGANFDGITVGVPESESVGVPEEAETGTLNMEGVTWINPKENSMTVSNTVYEIGEGQVLMISGQTQPVTFENCTFKLSGETVKISGAQDGISYNNGEVVTKLWIGGNVQFDNCLFVTEEGASKSTAVGYDAAIYFFSGDIQLNNSELSTEGYNGQFLGLYGKSGAVTFNSCDISTVGNKNGWSYAMYGASVLKLNQSTMTATGMSIDSGNTNAFYSGDNRTGYDAIYFEDSIVDFSDNQAGGFAINNVNIHVDNSQINVSNNAGNGCNSGYWIVNQSDFTMNGNRGGHALSCIGLEMTNSDVEILHNGYAGVYLQSRDSSFTNCEVDIRCNGEKLLSYSAGDLWLNGNTLTVSGGCSSDAQPGSAWLGGVGRKGAVVTQDSDTVVAYDLNSNAVDNLKSNTEPVLTGANIALNGANDKHTLFLNPFMESAYARGNAETTASNNDADLFKDDNVRSSGDIIGGDNAKIGTLTTAQLSHHIYDWDSGEQTSVATTTNYGVVRYTCTECASNMNNTETHPNGFDCAGTYVYAPLVGVSYDANAGTDAVSNMPSQDNDLAYGSVPSTTTPVRESGSNDWEWMFTGWYLDAECTQPLDPDTGLTANWTILYAGWQKFDTQPGGETADWDISKSKTATELNEDYESQITLSLPAASYERTMDVVFVIDDTHAGSDIFYNAVNNLLDELAAKDTLDIKVGVVAFDAVSRDWLNATSNGAYSGLVSIRDEQALAAVQHAIETQLNYEGTGTMLKVGATNTEWPVDMAKDMLDQGTGEEQYLIMFSDLYGYVYRGDLTLDGTTYHDVPLSKRIGTWNEGSLSMGIKYNTFAEAYAHKDEADDTPDGFFRDRSWESYWTTYQRLETAPGNTIAGSYQVASGTYSGFEKSLVLTYDNLLKAAEDAHVILVNNSFPIGDALSAQSMVQGMLDALEDNSTAKTYRYRTSSAGEALQGDAAKGIFDGIREDLIQLVDAGTTVEDYMGYVADDYNFNFVNDKDKLSMKVGDQTYPAVLIEENKYGFAPNESGYDYILTYVPGNKTSDEHFVWTTNVAVTKDAPVQLIYSVELMNPKTTPGTYGKYDADGSKGYDGLYTNNKAILYPVDSDGVKGLPEAFPKPTVDYTVGEPAPKTGSLTISKTVNGTTDRTVLAEKFTFKVTFSDGSTYPYFFTKGGSTSGNIASGGTIKIANGQTVSINGIPAGVDYTVSEIRDKDFNTTVSNSDGPALVTTYRTDTVDASGTIQAGIASIVHFTNTWKYGTPSGGGSGGGSKPELNKDDHIAYVSGYPDGTVQPQGYVTREEVATIFFRLLTDASRAEYITEFNPYPDVQSNRWSFYAITTMTNGNLMLGRPDGGFDPGANITRAEFAVVAAQFSDAEYSGPDRFTDISDHWARDYINRAANEGWIAGYPDGSFGPDRYITRAEVMALVNEVLERGPDADYMLEDMIVWPDNPEYAWYYEDVQEATNSHSYVWRNSPHTSEEWLELIPMRTFDELVRDAFNAAGK